MKEYNVNEIADLLNVNPETVRRWIRAKKLKATISLGRNGSTILASDLLDFIDNHKSYSNIEIHSEYDKDTFSVIDEDELKVSKEKVNINIPRVKLFSHVHYSYLEDMINNFISMNVESCPNFKIIEIKYDTKNDYDWSAMMLYEINDSNKD